MYRLMAAAAAVAILCMSGPAPAAEVSGRQSPSLWDPHRRPDRPDLKTLRQIRFLTEDEFPPFNFTGKSGELEGYNIDLARAVCAELGVPCTIQARRWDTIVAALEANQADVIAAGLAITPQARSRLLFSDPYLRIPARFAARRDQAGDPVDPQALAGKRIGVVQRTAHAAWLEASFPASVRVALPSEAAVQTALQGGKIDYAFGDSVRLAFWVNGQTSADCCRLVGGPYLESRYFGPGLALAVRPDDASLKRALDYALFRIWENGTWADIERRWFPFDLYGPMPAR